MKRLKRLKENEPFPDDFWNYNVNHITGYYLDKQDEHSTKMLKKYNKLTQSI
tara:strand:+ start:846 stop:1001 length:156 start_codon:yes stop_codon:yes gene_type:complete